MQPCIVSLILATLTFSQTGGVPDLSGTWKMISRKATYRSTPPKSLVYTIVQNGNAIEITAIRDGRAEKVKYLINGGAQIIGFPNSTSETVANAYWETSSLIIETKQNGKDPPPGSLTSSNTFYTSWYVERYTMSGDGKTLILTRRDVRTKDQVVFVFEKQ